VVNILNGAQERHLTTVRRCSRLCAKTNVILRFCVDLVFPCPAMCATIRVKVWDQVWDWFDGPFER
jgi:hypothetical protein